MINGHKPPPDNSIERIWGAESVQEQYQVARMVLTPHEIAERFRELADMIESGAAKFH